MDNEGKAIVVAGTIAVTAVVGVVILIKAVLKKV